MLTLAVVIALILPFGKPLLGIFNKNQEVIDTGFIRLSILMFSHTFSLFYETLSGYLRGFGISLTPAILTILGVCGIRITWIQLVFPRNPTFRTIIYAFPISLASTALLMLIAVMIYHPVHKRQKQTLAD